jgi:hypothetical protein
MDISCHSTSRYEIVDIIYNYSGVGAYAYEKLVLLNVSSYN